jgi:hypothetical protein
MMNIVKKLSPALGALAALAALVLTSCMHGSAPEAGAAPSAGAPSMGVITAAAPTPDPRVGLRAGWFDAAEASWNIDLVSKTQPSEKFLSITTPGASSLWNSDLAMSGNYVYQGNFSGYQVWDISNPMKPTLATAYVCPGSQSDVSVYRNLLFVSGESTAGRTDCGMEGVPDSVSQDRLRGIRIFDVSDVAHPKYLANVQTCRGSHTHTVVTDPKDAENVYIYISGSAGVRSANELAGCSAMTPDKDQNSSLFRIEIIKVPLAHPEQARVVNGARIFEGLTNPAKHGEPAADVAAAQARAAASGRAGGAGGRPNPAPGTAPGPTQCHDITVYPQIGLAGGACGGYGLLLDISDVANPKRIAAAADSNFSFWHSATFNNDGTKVLFSDEWGGGTQPRCRTTDKLEWGADAIFAISADKKMTFQNYYKMPAPQTVTENCVAHNGTLIPIPGRDVMVQAWYQGGLSMFDWTDGTHPKEIAYFDRGPMDAKTLYVAGYWSTYWYNGYIIASEIARGLDIFALKPSQFISQNEIDAAKSVRFAFFNAQDQPKFVWPATFALSRSFVDQLERSGGLSSGRISSVRSALADAEKQGGDARKSALSSLAERVDRDAAGSRDGAKVKMLASSVRDLANATK